MESRTCTENDESLADRCLVEGAIGVFYRQLFASGHSDDPTVTTSGNRFDTEFGLTFCEGPEALSKT